MGKQGVKGLPAHCFEAARAAQAPGWRASFRPGWGLRAERPALSRGGVGFKSQGRNGGGDGGAFSRKRMARVLLEKRCLLCGNCLGLSEWP